MEKLSEHPAVAEAIKWALADADLGTPQDQAAVAWMHADETHRDSLIRGQARLMGDHAMELGLSPPMFRVIYHLGLWLYATAAKDDAALPALTGPVSRA